jgi:predicted small lipoprotein YifL
MRGGWLLMSLIAACGVKGPPMPPLGAPAMSSQNLESNDVERTEP